MSNLHCSRTCIDFLVSLGKCTEFSVANLLSASGFVLIQTNSCSLQQNQIKRYTNTFINTESNLLVEFWHLAFEDRLRVVED